MGKNLDCEGRSAVLWCSAWHGVMAPSYPRLSENSKDYGRRCDTLFSSANQTLYLSHRQSGCALLVITITNTAWRDFEHSLGRRIDVQRFMIDKTTPKEKFGYAMLVIEITDTA